MNSIKFIENYYSVSQQTVYEWFETYDIKLKEHSTACKIGKTKQHSDIQFSKDYIENIYDRSLPLQYLADKLEVSYSHTKKLCKLYDIKVSSTVRSAKENELFQHCVNTYSGEWISNDRTLIGPLELDIYEMDRKIAIEYCGNVWHSENFGKKKSNYHKQKFDLCQSIDIKLLTIFESDDPLKVKKLLNTITGSNEKVFARKTIIKELDVKSAREFHDLHHMHGFIPARFHYGIYHNEELVMAASFGKSRYNKKYKYECARMTSHSDYTVVGGASKLFKHFERSENPESIITYADLRFGNGKVYEKCGFVFKGYSPPNYWYFHKSNPTKLFSRVSFQKHKLKNKLEKFYPDMTEYENMVINGWDRIWDCGNAIYTKKGGE